MTKTTGFDRKSFILSILFSIVLLLLAGILSLYVISDKAVKEMYLLSNALEAIENNFFEPVDRDQMISDARDAMFAKLDRYSTYYPNQKFDELDEEMTGSYSGIGISVLWHEQGLLIMSVRENGPAYDAGLLTGDIILKADSVLLTEIHSSISTSLLRGKENTQVELEVLRPSTDETFSVKVTRKKIHFEHIPFAGLTKDSLVYIRLLDFDFGASADLESALDSLVINAPVRPKGIILDLQGNPGGLFSEAHQTANLFLDKGTLIVGTDGRSRWRDEAYYSTGKDITNGLPLAILVDKGSASSSEIVSGALQTSGRAFLVGDTTFGKGLVQGFVQFPNGDGVKLTVSRYYFSDSTYLNDFDSTLNEIGHGLVPNYFFQKREFNYFMRTLESSFILRQFAEIHQDAILEDYQDYSLNDSWVDLFADYIESQELNLLSYRSELAELLKAIGEEEKVSPKTSQMIERLIDESKKYDHKNVSAHAEYIKERLAQIAIQRSAGEYKMYKDVLLSSRPEIIYASQILLQQVP